MTSLRMRWLWSSLSLLSGNLVRTSGARSGSRLYLTFDDGPHPEHTPKLLDLLARHDAKATFFLIGRVAEQFPDLVRRIVAAGHTIGNHSMTHPRMRTLSAREQWNEIEQAGLALRRLDSTGTHAWRPPNGRLTAAMLLFCVWRRMPVALWTVDSLDYRLDAEAVVQRLLGVDLNSGDVLLFHDDGACAVDALEVLLPAWNRANFELAALQ